MFFSRSTPTTAALLVLWLSVLPTAPSFASTTIYSYTNDEGVQTFTNELASVPEKYRPQLTQRSFDTPARPETPAPDMASEPRPRSAEARTITARGEYRMGDHDNRADAVRLATEAAKQDALEQVATYVERITEVKDLNVTRDDIRSFTAGVVRVIDQTVTTRLEQD